MQILTYDPGFKFKTHIDAEVNWSMFIPNTLKTEASPWLTRGDRPIPGSKIYTLFYSTNIPTLTTGAVIHRVPK